MSPPPVAGYAGWYDASDITSISATQWNDLSGNARHGVQPTGAAMPTTGIHTLNGLNVLSFDGGDQLDTTLSASLVDCTVFVVAKAASTGTAFELLSGADAVPNGSHRFYISATRHLTLEIQNMFLVGGADTAFTDTAAHIYSYDFSTTSNSIFYRIDGVLGFSNTSHGRVPTAGKLWSIGGKSVSNKFQGDIAEIIVYPTVLSGSDRALVEAYLTLKWFTAGAANYFTTLNVTQTQTASLTKKLGKKLTLAVTQSQTATLTKKLAKKLTLAVTNSQVPTLTRRLVKLLTLNVTNSSTATVRRGIAKRLSATSTQTASLLSNVVGTVANITIHFGRVTTRWAYAALRTRWKFRPPQKK